LSNSSCKPFDKKRDGITVGEGAGFLVLENLEHALKRGASILAEVIGYNIACDAYHLTTPDIQGIMASKSMEKAIMMSNISPSDISYISPHGTGTYSNDLQEANAIFKVFGEKGSTVPISAIKSILGHCMGSASAIEAIAITLSIVNNVIPKTINVDSTDSTFPCELNTTQYEDTNISTVLSNSFAFGGNICAVVFSKY
jgi:3-oxoacyl-[acyl-carrier-protein] synthase II